MWVTIHLAIKIAIWITIHVQCGLQPTFQFGLQSHSIWNTLYIQIRIVWHLRFGLKPTILCGFHILIWITTTLHYPR